jgi:transcriptional regulator with XRE-family HTH domain
MATSGAAVQRGPVTSKCPVCRQEFTASRASRQIYCSRGCMGAANSQAHPSNPLKAKVLVEVRARKLTYVRLAQETGIGRSTLEVWLRRRGSLLTAPKLQAIAQWLGITPAEALALQGDDEAKHRLERAQQGLASQKLADYQERMRTDKAFRQRQLTRVGSAARGKKFSADHRAKIGQKLAEAHQRPEGHAGVQALSQYNTSLRGAAQKTRTALRRHHPDWADDEITAWTVKRLMQRFDLADEAAARTLLEPRPQPRQRKGPQGRKRLDQRARIIADLDATWPRVGKGRRADGFWEEVGARAAAAEGKEDAYTALHMKTFDRQYRARMGHQR